ncbi:MAG TPA: DUF2752 domain-containing protein [Mycobacterium sp.]|nr:DUF2752 domain-containing protein [Mycobacterium sp.]
MGPSTRSGNRRRWYGALGALALLAGALAYVGFVDPHRPGSMFPTFPACPFRLLTGWNCPSCGGLRMAHDLLTGDLAAAVMDNVFLLFGIPLLTAWILLRRRRGQTLAPVSAVVAVTVAAAAWTVLRNMPGFPLVPTLLVG